MIVSTSWTCSPNRWSSSMPETEDKRRKDMWSFSWCQQQGSYTTEHTEFQAIPGLHTVTIPGRFEYFLWTHKFELYTFFVRSHDICIDNLFIAKGRIPGHFQRRPEWGTSLPETLIDHTERCHDDTFISVDVESQENLRTIFNRIFAKENIVYMSILWNFHQKNWWVSRTLNWCTKSFQNKSHSVLFWDKN
jgi:hypothetical protein